jgi:hypothetical protein
MFKRHDQEVIVFEFYACFHEQLPTVVVLEQFTNPTTVGTCLKGLTNN